MEGGRGGGGGGRGKGKKAKAAKKKAAAAAVAQAAAPSNPKKSKKVGANHAAVQVVSVLPKASAASHTATTEASNAAAPHDQTMTKSKRKRLKRAATTTLLKKQEAIKAAQAQVPQAKKSPTAASPKVAVLTPRLAIAASIAVKPHVVSLTGGKKKKRKRNAAGSTMESGADAVRSSATSVSPKEAGKPQQTKKMVAVLSHSPSAATQTKASAASPKKKLAQHVQKSESVDSAVKVEEMVASPLHQTIKKVKTKLPALSGNPVGAAPVVSKPVSSIEGTHVDVKKLRPKTEAQQPNVVVSNSYSVLATETSKATKSETEMEKLNIYKAKSLAKKSPVHLQVQNEKNESPVATLPTSTAVTTREKVVTTMEKPAAGFGATAVSTSAADGVSERSRSQESNPSAATSLTSTATPVSVATTSPTPLLVTESKMSSSAVLPSGNLKRPRTADQVPSSSVADCVPPPAKRSAVAVASKATVKASPQSGSPPSEPALVSNSRTGPKPSPVNVEGTNVAVKVGAIIERLPIPEVTGPPPSHQSAASPPTRKIVTREPATHGHPTTQSVDKLPLKAAPELKPSSIAVKSATPMVSKPTTEKAKPAGKVEVNTSTTGPKECEEVDRESTTGASIENVSTTKKLGIIMDSHVYVEKMMKGVLEKNNLSFTNSRPARSAQPTQALPSRPKNAWGASFGMVPPAQTSSSTPRRLVTTPLSSWFLSKGCANFVKQVHFSDDDGDGNSSDGDDGSLSQQPSISGGASPKRRATIAKKNAFLESLKTQSNWRTWYGNVDLHDLLDPPLAYIPEKLREHEVSPLALPEPTTETKNKSSGTTKKAYKLEMLEDDIRREKQRGSAFGEQLLMMLQGKTVSGKLLEEEYRPLLQQ